MGSLNFEDLPEAAQQRLLARADPETRATIARATAKPEPAAPKAARLAPSRDRSGGPPAPRMAQPAPVQREAQTQAPRAPQARVGESSHDGLKDFMNGLVGGITKGYRNKRRPAR